MRVNELRSALTGVGFSPTPRELAELLLLAHHMSASDVPGNAIDDGPLAALEPESVEGDPFHVDLGESGTLAVGDDQGAAEFTNGTGNPDGGHSVYSRPGRSVDTASADLLVPAISPLGSRLPFQRALRPLKRQVTGGGSLVDEAATADALAEQPNATRIWAPILKPDSE